MAICLLAAAGYGLAAHPLDVRRFHAIAQHRGRPYADFPVEYPPLTLAAIDALDGRTVREATVHLMWSQVALDGLIAD